MKNNRGQALVEFIIIMPVLLLIVLAIIDFGNIILKKYALENDLDTICDMYNSNNKADITNYLDKIDANMKVSSDDKFIKISLDKDIKVSSPLVNAIIGKTYNIKVDKTIYNEQT